MFSGPRYRSKAPREARDKLLVAALGENDHHLHDAGDDLVKEGLLATCDRIAFVVANLTVHSHHANS